VTKIKLCGIYRQEDAELVNQAKPDYFGMVIHFPKSHRNVSREQAAWLRAHIRQDIPAVGVFVNQPVEEIISLLNDGIIDIAQLHGGEGEADILAIREATGKPVWKAFRIRSAQDVENARNSPADLVLLDNGYGTGESFDWRLVGAFSRPFGLAGGLTPENLPQAIAQINPTLVDLSSGIETNKQKDLKKMLRAVAATHSIERN
jgi:phosphoribosylanthranilate isomerase